MFLLSKDILLNNYRIIIKIRTLTLIHHYHLVHTPHGVSLVVPILSFFSKGSTPGSCVAFSCYIHLSRLLQSGIIPQSFLDFYDLDIFEDYRLIITGHC